MGAASIVEIPFAVSAVTALNDDGTFCGSALVRGKYVPFRYSNDKGKELLQTGALDTTAVDMNGSRDLIGAYNGVYRGDWGGWVALNNLVVGNTTDVNRWLANSHSLARIHDRAGTANSGVVVANDRGAIAVLTPEPAQ
jgi:hypothetical protein